MLSNIKRDTLSKEKIVAENDCVLLIHGNSLQMDDYFKDNSVDCIICSPPYWQQRNYGTNPVKWPDGWVGELGQEPQHTQYIEHMMWIFGLSRHILKPTGTCFVVLGDTYASPNGGMRTGKTTVLHKKHIDARYFKSTKKSDLPDKCLCNIPSRFSLAMTDAGWLQRNRIVWYKRNAMPSSATDRFTVDFEDILFFTKQEKYYFETQLEPYNKPLNRWGGEAIKEGSKSMWCEQTGQNTIRPGRMMRPNPAGRVMRCVWDIPTEPSEEEHTAKFPASLVRIMVKAGSPRDGTVLDLFCGSGVTGKVAVEENRKFIGIDIKEQYIKDFAHKKVKAVQRRLV